MTIQVTGPILLPNTPDCDYPSGEEPLTALQISQLIQTFKNYNIIDYEHEFTNPDHPYFLQNIGVPVRLFQVDHEVTFTDMANNKITVPAGTAWLTSNINDDYVEKQVNDNLIVAYSVTIAEQEDADYFMGLYNTVNTAFKDDTARQKHKRITSKRTLIKDIQNPAMLSVSVVKFPCVYKAMFCKNSVRNVVELETNNKSDNMSEDYTEQNLLDEIKAGLKNLRNSNKGEVEVEGEQEGATGDEPVTTDADDNSVQPSELDADVKKFIQTEIQSIKEDLLSQQETQNKEVLEAISALKTEQDTQTTSSDKEEEEEEEEEEDAEIPDDEVEEPAKKEDEPATVEDVTETSSQQKPIQQKSSVGKAFSKKAEENRIKNKTAQPSRRTTLKHEGGQTGMKPIHERDIIKNAIKGDGTVAKTAVKENRKIIYATKEYNLVPYYQHTGVLNQLNKAGKHVFQESFSEEETNKAILSTEMFAQYVREMITPEAIFDAANYQTVYGEEAPIRRVRAAKSWTSQDGHLAANYYYDATPDAAELKHEKDVIRPVTQRDLFSISDRQLRNNVFGDDLLDVSLETVKETFYNGVYAARILGDTSKDGQKFTNSENEQEDIDKQFTRKDGWVKQAGVQLSSDSDFDINKIIDVFDTMYYSLPEYAQEESNYMFFVPSQIRRAYYNHFVRNSRESKLDLVSEQKPLYFNNIPIVTSKTLSSAEFRNMLTGGDAKICLFKPQNTLLGVGRSFGIEPERRADISATYYYLTLDTDAKFVKPEESVVATVSADDYATIPVTTEPSP